MIGDSFEPREVLTSALELLTACHDAGYITDDQMDAAVTEPEAEPVDEPEPSGPTVGAGVWTVGEDMDPGVWRTVGIASGDCYWAILESGTNGEEIIANYLGAGRPIVVVEEGHDFESSRCGQWALVDLDELREDADPAGEIGEGIWTVGVDIAAGTWRPVEGASEDCYWAIHATGNNGEDIISNGLGGGRPTVNLSEGQDFETSRCGDWERQ